MYMSRMSGDPQFAAGARAGDGTDLSLPTNRGGGVTVNARDTARANCKGKLQGNCDGFETNGAKRSGGQEWRIQARK